MPRSRILRKEADWSDTSESEAESTDTVLENTATGGPVTPLLAPSTEPGPVGAPLGTMPPPPTSGATATAVIPYRQGYTPHGRFHTTALPKVRLGYGLSDKELPGRAPEG